MMGMYEALREVVKAASFHYEEELEPFAEGGQVGVRYGDDRYDFSVVCSDNYISIRRAGSRLKLFHEWYEQLMPSAQGILQSITAILNRELTRDVSVIRASYSYEFLIYDMVRASTGESAKNWEIVRKLLTAMPDEGGAMVESSPAGRATPMSRSDISMSRWVGDAGHRRIRHYSLEAPGNLGWSTLWFTFQYRGETYTDPDSGVREPFLADAFLTEYPTAYVDFLRDNAISGFLRWLLDGYHFKSAASFVP
jgi:hypothetical protein